MRRIYLASSWRNSDQPRIVDLLRDAGHEVYDFRNPPEHAGFGWEGIHAGWKGWTVGQFREALRHPLAERGYAADLHGMEWADTCVLLLPCGRSAHLEAGWFTGRGLPVVFVMPNGSEPELMYKLGGPIVGTDAELLAALEVPVGLPELLAALEVPVGLPVAEHVYTREETAKVPASAARLSNEGIESLLNYHQCPDCDSLVRPAGCGFPQSADSSWECEDDEDCGWQGTGRELIGVALTIAALGVK